MNTLLYNNRNGCFKICNTSNTSTTCKDNDKLYRWEYRNENEDLLGYIDYTKINEETEIIYTFTTEKPWKAKTDGEYWYSLEEANNTWYMVTVVDTNTIYMQDGRSYKTIIKCDN